MCPLSQFVVKTTSATPAQNGMMSFLGCCRRAAGNRTATIKKNWKTQLDKVFRISCNKLWVCSEQGFCRCQSVLPKSKTVMLNCTIKHGIKLPGRKLYKHGVISLAIFQDVLDYSQRTFYPTLKLWHETGDVISTWSWFCGCYRLLNYDDVSILLLLMENNPNYFLDKLLHLLETNQFISAHCTYIHHVLECAGFSHKKLTNIAIERDEFCRANFIHHMSQYTPCQLRFLDKTLKDEWT